MKEIISSFVAFLGAIIGLSGGIIWLVLYDGGAEAIILSSLALLEIVAFIFLKKNKSLIVDNIVPLQSFTPHISIDEPFIRNIPTRTIDRDAIIESRKSTLKILFIDDDKNFSVVRILKNSGWKQTKTITDVKTLEIPLIKESEIIFVDINGVGILLNLEHQGLDLALMLKQKYPDKKVIIYSANKNSYSFHDAWDLCDYKLEKNALPYQFQNLVEEYSIELYISR